MHGWPAAAPPTPQKPGRVLRLASEVQARPAPQGAPPALRCLRCQRRERRHRRASTAPSCSRQQRWIAGLGAGVGAPPARRHRRRSRRPLRRVGALGRRGRQDPDDLPGADELPFTPPLHSWLVGLLAVMNAAALRVALAPDNAPPHARCASRWAAPASGHLTDAVRVTPDADARDQGDIALTFEEFVDQVAELERCGFAMPGTAARRVAGLPRRAQPLRGEGLCACGSAGGGACTVVGSGRLETIFPPPRRTTRAR